MQLYGHQYILKKKCSLKKLNSTTVFSIDDNNKKYFPSIKHFDQSKASMLKVQYAGFLQ